jgi:signal transduction histidine kinase
MANRALASMLGYDDPAELRGVSLARFHPQPELAGGTLSEKLAEGPMRDLEMEARRADGSTLLVRINARMEDSGDGAPVIVIAVTALGSHRGVFDELGRSQKMEAMERFAGGVAHDYNNLLTTIIAEASQLVGELTPSSEAHESARIIMRSARRAAEITGRLLLFSRAEAGQPQVLDINDAIRAAEASLQGALTGGTSLELRLDPEVGRAHIDPSHLRAILSNLVSNASEAMPYGGRAVVATMTFTAPRDTEGLDFHPRVPPGEYVSIVVGDTGVGMDADTRARVFDPFFTTKERGAGVGLGLTTVYGLVLRAAGHLALISAPTWGTLVRVLLPMTDTPVEADAGHPAPPPHVDASPRQARILVVDDEGPVLRVMCKILRRAGYIVHPAGGPFEAQDEIRRRGCELDLVVSDVMMPGMNGTELAAWLHARCPDTPVLLVSGYADSDLVSRWREHDPRGFLSKPFEPTELLDRVKERLGRVSTGG